MELKAARREVEEDDEKCRSKWTKKLFQRCLKKINIDEFFLSPFFCYMNTFDDDLSLLVLRRLVDAIV